METYPKIFPEYYKNGEDFIEQHIFDGRGKCEFFNCDSEENYLTNLETQPEDWRYRNKKITYTINSLGYRTKEFDEIDWKNSIVVIGCSFTFGLGVDDEENFPYLLSLLTGRYVVNLGVIGGSNQLMLDTSLMLKKKYGNPYMLIMNWTSTARFPYYGEDMLKHVGYWSTIKEEDVKLASLYYNLYIDKTHEMITFRNILNTFKNIWSDKTRCYHISFFYETAYYGEIDLFFEVSPHMMQSRDLMHPSFLDYSFAVKRIHELIMGKKLLI